MPRLGLKSISLRNWMRCREATLDFPQVGLVAVIGVNRAAAGRVDSIGTGKTQLGEAISRTLLGVPGRFSTLGHYSMMEKGDTYVRVEATLGDKPLTVELGYDCPEFGGSGEGLRWTLGAGPVIERGHPRETRAELSDMLISPLLAEWSIHVDGEQLKFNRLSQDEAVRLLLDCLDQPPWSRYAERAKRARDAAQAETAEAGRRRDAASSQLQAAKESVTEAEGRLATEKATYDAAVLARNAALASLAGRRKELTGRLEASKRERETLTADLQARVNAAGERHKEAELAMTEIRARISHGRHNLEAWEGEVEEAQGEARKVARDLQGAEETPDKCPTCSKPWDRRPTKDELTALREDLAAARERVQTAEKSRDATDAYIQRQKDLLSQKERADEAAHLKAVGDLSEKIEKAETERDRVHQQIEALDASAPGLPDESEVKSWTARLSERRQRRDATEADLKAAAATMVQAERKASVATYWTKGFGAAGVPNIVLRRTVGPLNEAATAVSAAMCGGVVSAKFDTAVELASGEARAKLSIKTSAEFGAVRLAGNSKGEGGLVNLVVAEAQAMVGRVFDRVGYRWLDEPVNSQDQLVRRQVYAYLRSQAEERGLLTFIVDHYPEARACADRVLIAEKGTDGCTTYRWD